MKRLILLILLAASVTISIAQTTKPAKQKNEKDSTANIKYTCTMHPEILSDKPGKCPKCGMTLVPKKSKKKNAK